jgi:hypothetical protein
LTVGSRASRACSAAHELSATTARPPWIFASATKPGTAFAAASFQDFGSPAWTGDRTMHATLIPGSRTSDANTASPATIRGPSTRLRSRPISLNSDFDFSRGAAGTGSRAASAAREP